MEMGMGIEFERRELGLEQIAVDGIRAEYRT